MEYITNAPKGAALLTSRKPGWFRDFDIRTFSIHDIWNCALGKTYGTYGEGLRALFGDEDYSNPDTFHFGKAQEFGFNSTGGNGDRLQLEWIHVITGLQLSEKDTHDE